MDYEDIRYEVEAPNAIVTIDRPERLNAFRGRTIEELIHAFKRAWADREVACVIFTGAGEREAIPSSIAAQSPFIRRPALSQSSTVYLPNSRDTIPVAIASARSFRKSATGATENTESTGRQMCT